MHDDANGVVQAADDEELVTTVPNPQPTGEWSMPEPVFRKTSGRLPQGYEKELENARAEHAFDQAQAAQPSFDSAPEEPNSKSSTVKLILVLLGLAAMIAFIAIFLTVVYFFFLR